MDRNVNNRAASNGGRSECSEYLGNQTGVCKATSELI